MMGGIADVELDNLGFRASLAELLDRRIALGEVARANDYAGCAFQVECGLEAEAAIAAGDESYLISHECLLKRDAVLLWIRRRAGKVQDGNEGSPEMRL